MQLAPPPGSTPQAQQHIRFNQLPAAASSASRMGHHIKKASNALMHNGYAYINAWRSQVREGALAHNISVSMHGLLHGLHNN